MSRKAIKWLYQELPELVAKGILTQETSERVRQHYGEIKSASKTPVVIIISGILGVLLIGLGIILLLAHNWEQFSRFTRALLSFAPLVIGQGFAKLTTVTTSEPHGVSYIQAKVRYVSGNKVQLDLPIDRYYMEEKSAPAAEKVYREYSRPDKQDACVLVRAKDGFAVIEALYIGGKRIEEAVKNVKNK